MSRETSADIDQNVGLSPFVLKWAEQAPAEILWTQRSMFSPAINGLDIYQATENDNPETTGIKSDTTSTQVF